MEEVYELSRFFPQGTTDQSLNSYIDHHLASVSRCIDNELYSSAYSHLHLLYMSFIYIQLLRIAKEREEEIKYAWIGFPRQERDYSDSPTSPFSFSLVNETAVFRFFRLVGLADSDIGNIAKPVETRNNRMHAKGVIHCQDYEAFENELSEYIRRIRLVVNKEMPFLRSIYKDLIKTYDSEYEFTVDDLESNFIDQYLFSEYELTQLADNRRDLVSKFIQDLYA